MNEEEIKIEEKMKNLPEDIKKAIFSNDTAMALQRIGDRYSLHIDQIGKLVEETGLVMVGLKPSNSFADNLVEELGVEKDTVNLIINDINQEVFGQIRESLRRIQEGNAVESRPAPQPIPQIVRKEEPVVINKPTTGFVDNGEFKQINREEILKTIEDPTENHPTQTIKAGEEKSISPLNIAEQKLSGSFKVESTEKKEEERTIASIKKADPYREQV